MTGSQLRLYYLREQQPIGFLSVWTEKLGHGREKNKNDKNLRGITCSQSHLRRLETVFRDTYRLYPKRSKTNFPSSESNQFHTLLDQRIEFLNKGRSMTIAFIMLISVMGKSRYIVIGDGRGESSIYFFPQPITSGFFFLRQGLAAECFLQKWQDARLSLWLAWWIWHINWTLGSFFYFFCRWISRPAMFCFDFDIASTVKAVSENA